MQFEGSVFARGEDGYEDARQAAAWNARKPHRFPEVIVQALSDADVVAAVALAGERGLKVKARAGGHSWSASGIRSGVLVDLSRMTEVSFDADRGVASVQPGVKGRDLNALLAEHDLFFPSGHCPTVGLGGFLLQGGWGWNSRAIGPACLSIVGVDVVTADGELIHADEDHNTDYLWAARGAGAGFFGIVTRFELRCHPRPTATYTRTDVYSLDDIDEVLSWALEFEPTLPAEFEFAILGTTPTLPDGRTVHDGTALMLMCQALMYDDHEARAALARLDECPVLDRALHREAGAAHVVRRPLRRAQLDRARGRALGRRRDVDQRRRRRAARTGQGAVSRRAHAGVAHLLVPVAPARSSARPPSRCRASSTWPRSAGWHDPDEDERYIAWPTDHMRRLESLSAGIQLADENLWQRPARYLSPENEARLERLRAQYDPYGRFHSYLTAAGGTE